jgi:adenosylmethionine-8-amino-7-oxononanoate aminotransferase
METAALAELDRRVLWHPFTPQQAWAEEPPLVIERAQGSMLYDTEGRGYIDGVSSLWCNVHGHRHPHIDAAVRAQLDRVAHSTMLGLSHPAAIELAERLVRIAPAGLTRVFYSDSGSTAVEVALKMAYQWWSQREDAAERPRRDTFIRLRDAYHGDTIGSVSAGGIDLFHACYRPLLFDTLQADPGEADHMAALLEEHGERVCAVIVEPLVQGAAGILVHPPGYLRTVRELCDAHGVPLICDEVATGFGRTGRMFACEHEDVVPDLMCVAKGLTGGYLPLAATLTTERIYEGFLGRPEDRRTFFHGHTYTGNPLACAAAIATLELFESERTLELLERKITLLGRWLKELVRPLPAVAAIRRRGFMCGIELRGYPSSARMGHQVTLAARRHGAIVRPLGDVVVLMPPLSIGEDELRRLVELTARAIAEATAAPLPVAA